MPWWPGWNSIADAEAWSNFYFWLGIGALLLLGASEVVAHRYSLRKDELVAIAQQNTQSQHDAEAASLREELAVAKAAREPRHLRPDERERLVAALNQIPHFAVIIKAGTTGGDERAYADEIAATMKGWDVHVDNAIHMGPAVTGMWLKMHGKGGEVIPPNVIAFRDAMVAAGLDMRRDNAAAFQADEGVPIGEVWLCIGSKDR